MKEWKDIPGYEGRYQINLDGEVRSLGRFVTVKSKLGKERQQFVKGTKTVIRKKRDGYLYANINGSGKALHRLMYITFVDSQIEGLDIDHLDGNRENFKIHNLRACKRVNNLTYKNVKRKNKYGYVGVKKGPMTKKYGQRWISVVWDPKLNKNVHRHKFSTPKDAHEDYCKRRLEIYGDNFKEQE